LLPLGWALNPCFGVWRGKRILLTQNGKFTPTRSQTWHLGGATQMLYHYSKAPFTQDHHTNKIQKPSVLGGKKVYMLISEQTTIFGGIKAIIRTVNRRNIKSTDYYIQLTIFRLL
jgi:hypothetical protein